MQLSSAPKISLEEVKDILTGWRQNKRLKFEAMPKDIRILIAQLVSEQTYSKYKITSVLGLNYGALKSILAKHHDNVNIEVSKQAKQDKFVPFHLVSLEEKNANTHSIKFEILGSGGTKLIIYSSEITSVIKAFLCCN